MCRDKKDIEVVTIHNNWNSTLSVVICTNVTYFIDDEYNIYDKNPILHPDSIVNNIDEINLLIDEIDLYSNYKL